MKKILSLTLTALLLLALFGCNQQAQPLDTGPSESVPTATVESTAPPETTVPTTEPTEPATTSVTEPPESSEPEQPTEAPRETEPKEQSSEPETKPTDPVPTTEPTQPATEATTSPQTEPTETTPPATEPAETQPPSTDSNESAPSETLPPAEEPVETLVPETELAKEVIDTAVLEAYARSYAEATYGYKGTANCNPSTNAGYFPGVRTVINTMDAGYAAAREAIDYQYACDISMGRTICTEIDGVMRRRNINVYFEPTSEPNVFIVWCYYGGEA